MNRDIFISLALWSCIAVVTAQQPKPSSTDEGSAYQISDDILIRMRDGGTVSAVVVKKRGSAARLPALLTVDIYTDPASEIARAKEAAAHGYVGMIADARGKRLSPDPILPYEHESSDGFDVELVNCVTIPTLRLRAAQTVQNCCSGVFEVGES